MQNFKVMLTLGSLVAGLLVAGCSGTTSNVNMPTGASAYDVVPAAIPVPTAYPVRPRDKLSLRVFGEPEISQENLRVDESGMIQIALIGSVKAQGRSVDEINAEITQRLASSFLRNPQVALSVSEAAPSQVSVEGEVKRPGVYEIEGPTTLLSALARAESPTLTAKLDEIVVFRTMNDQRMAARFNLKDIRLGLSPDPMILDGDVVMVGHSRSRAFWQDILKTAPFFNAFALIATR